MVTLINFSHPLTEDAKRILHDRYGVTVIHDVAVQLNTDQPLAPQLDDIMLSALRLAPDASNVDAMILPDHSAVASYLARWFWPANIVVMTATAGPGRQYMPTELLRRCGAPVHRRVAEKAARAQRGREYRFGWTAARDGCRPGLVVTEHERAGYVAAQAHYAALARVDARQAAPELEVA